MRGAIKQIILLMILKLLFLLYPTECRCKKLLLYTISPCGTIYNRKNELHTKKIGGSGSSRKFSSIESSFPTSQIGRQLTSCAQEILDENFEKPSEKLKMSQDIKMNNLSAEHASNTENSSSDSYFTLQQAELKAKADSLLASFRNRQANQLKWNIVEEIKKFDQQVKLKLRNDPAKFKSPKKQCFVGSAERKPKSGIANFLPAELTTEVWISRLEKLFKSGQFSKSQFNCESLRKSSTESIASILCKSAKSDLIGREIRATLEKLESELEIPEEIDQIEEEKLKNFLGQWRHLANNIEDSEATESESEDAPLGKFNEWEEKLENSFVKKTLTEKRPIPIEKRASYRWQIEKASLGSRMTYLECQLHEVDKKMKQYAQVYKKVIQHRNIAVQSEEMPIEGGDLNDDGYCARTRLYNFRPRTRLINFKELNSIGKRMSLLPNCECDCYDPYEPCILCCTGKYKKEFPDRSINDILEQAAVFDTSYHQNLTDHRYLPIDQQLQAFRYEGSFRTIKKASRKVPIEKSKKPDTIDKKQSDENKNGILKNTLQSITKAQNVEPKKTLTPGPLLKKLQLLNMTSLSKAKRVRRSANISDNSETDSEDSVGTVEEEEPEDDDDDDDYVDSDYSGSATLTVGVSKASSSHNRTRRRDSRDATNSTGKSSAGKIHNSSRRSTAATYDIDNIFIDPSVAAASRIEILQYKEIVTPRWREKAYEPLTNSIDSSASMVETEDLTNEAFLRRHEKKEKIELNRAQKRTSAISMDFTISSTEATPQKTESAMTQSIITNLIGQCLNKLEMAELVQNDSLEKSTTGL